jgi:hypothetical protein
MNLPLLWNELVGLHFVTLWQVLARPAKIEGCNDSASPPGSAKRLRSEFIQCEKKVVIKDCFMAISP